MFIHTLIKYHHHKSLNSFTALSKHHNEKISTSLSSLVLARNKPFYKITFLQEALDLELEAFLLAHFCPVTSLNSKYISIKFNAAIVILFFNKKLN